MSRGSIQSFGFQRLHLSSCNQKTTRLKMYYIRGVTSKFQNGIVIN
jgi:hypothetical protein